MKHKKYKQTTISLCVACALAHLPVANAQENDKDSEVTMISNAEQKPTTEHKSNKDILVLDKATVIGRAEQKPTTERKSRQDLNKEMVSDNKDLVRYSIDVGLLDNGRIQRGFSMRGVEGNRVAITFDGMDLPNSEENSIYEGYGNMNASRIQIDPELARGIDINKGADSYNVGSGAIGGSVNYRSLEATDIVGEDGGFGGMLRGGYQNKNSEWFSTVGMGYIGESFDAAIVASKRKGHETESAGGGDLLRGPSRQEPNPSDHDSQNYLVKLNYHITPEHHVGAALTRQNRDDDINMLSYSSTRDRHSQLETKLDTNHFYYEWTPDNAVEALKIAYDYQKTDLGAITTDFLSRNRQRIKNRRFATELKRFTFNLDLSPMETAFGEHRFSLKTSAGSRDWRSPSLDTSVSSTGVRTPNPYIIQYPTTTDTFDIGLNDNAQWNDTFSSDIGLRYNRTKVSVQKTDDDCPNCIDAPSNTFNNWGGSIGLNAQLDDTWKVGYQLGSGYRVPSSSEMYFTYETGFGVALANPDLKSERSTDHTLFLHAYNDIGNLNASLYHNRYNNFLYEEISTVTRTSTFTGRPRQVRARQMVNVDKAKVSGIELSGTLNLDKVMSAPEGLSFTGALGYSKGKLSNGTSLMSVQPLKAVAGLDYDDPDERWGVSSRLSYLGSKKAKDAQVFDNTGQNIIDYEHLNKSALVFDLFGYYKPTKDFTLRAGLLNLFDKKYHTWNALRGVSNSVGDRVDSDGFGLERFYSPGRNFSVSFDYKF